MSRLSPAIFLLAAVGALVGPPAGAAQRVFVASYGLDANTASNCNLLNPCRGFTAAMTVVDPGGEVVALDGAGYGVVTITKSVTITANPGFYAGISAFTGNAVTINTPGIRVTLRGLNLNGIGAVNGVFMSSAAAGTLLQVENCVISNFTGTGITVHDAGVRVTDTTIRDNGSNGLVIESGGSGTVTRSTISGNSNIGVFVYVTDPATLTTAEIADSTLDGNLQGFVAFVQGVSAGVKASVHDSRVVNNTTNGMVSNSGTSGSVALSASNNLISNNEVAGIVVYNTGGKVWASGNTISSNGTGILNTTGLFESAGNNAVRNNTADTSGAITVIATK